MNTSGRPERLKCAKEIIAEIDGELTKRNAPKTVLELQERVIQLAQAPAEHP